MYQKKKIPYQDTGMLKLADVEQVYSLEHEKALLGCLMLQSDLFIKCIDKKINKNTFYDTDHKYIFEAIELLYGENEMIHTLSIMAKIHKAGHDVLLSYLADLPDMVPLSSGIDGYINELKILEHKRVTTRAGVEMINMSAVKTSEIDEIIEATEQNLERVKLELFQPSRTRFDLPEMISHFCNYREIIDDDPDFIDSRLIYTGYPSWDKFRLERGSLAILAGHSNAGKTAMVVNLIDRWMKKGYRIRFVSLETDEANITFRLASVATGIPVHALKGYNRGLTNTDNSRIDTFVEEYTYRYDFTLLNPLEAIRPRYIRDALKDVIDSTDIVILDHIGELQIKGMSAADRADDIGVMVSEMRHYARKHNILFLALNQINRSTREEPTVLDLTGSDKLRAKSDYIFIIDRPASRMDEKVARERNVFYDMNIIAAKCREAATGRAVLQFEPETTTFREKPSAIIGG